MTREQAIEEITRRLADYYHPERIYLFGSAAAVMAVLTAILTSAWSCRTMPRRGCTGQVYIARYGMWGPPPT